MSCMEINGGKTKKKKEKRMKNISVTMDGGSNCSCNGNTKSCTSTSPRALHGNSSRLSSVSAKVSKTKMRRKERRKERKRLLTCSRDIDPSLNSIFCRPSAISPFLSSSSSSSSSGSNMPLPVPPRMPPNAAFFPASEKGVDATAVPKTLAFAGTPKVAKSVTTLRGGECGVPPVSMDPDAVNLDANSADLLGVVGGYK